MLISTPDFRARVYSPLLVALVLAPVRCLRRMAVIRRPFPAEWRAVLEHRVRFSCALDDAKKERFLQMVSVFLDEVLVTGVRTEVDDTVRVLVAAGAIIPVFRFEDWEYHRLGQVLVYPAAFDHEYKVDQPADANILGLAGWATAAGPIHPKQEFDAGANGSFVWLCECRVSATKFFPPVILRSDRSRARTKGGPDFARAAFLATFVC